MQCALIKLDPFKSTLPPGVREGASASSFIVTLLASGAFYFFFTICFQLSSPPASRHKLRRAPLAHSSWPRTGGVAAPRQRTAPYMADIFRPFLYLCLSPTLATACDDWRRLAGEKCSFTHTSRHLVTTSASCSLQNLKYYWRGSIIFRTAKLKWENRARVSNE